ncbi:MAG: DUF2341 domain-containing protein, partial [Kiritimatiellae bacterium]|nr:DUF2341 domain-containing protein [Kiritimatiellia bacterium]
TLDHEIERHVLTSGELIAWVRVPVLDGDADTVLYLYFGNSTVTESQEAAEGVWDTNFVAVLHMEETSGAVLDDSTAYSNDATAQAGVTLDVAGRIAGGDAFSGTNSPSGLATITNNATLEGMAGLTMEMWLYPYQLRSFDTLVSKGGWDKSWHSHMDAAGKVWWGATANDTTGRVSFAGALSAATWQHFTCWFEGNNEWRLYRDGALLASNTTTVPVIPIASYNVLLGVNFYLGVMDEFRISNVARSADWLATCHTNQLDPAGFVSVGTNENNLTTGWAPGYAYRKKITIDADAVSGAGNLLNFPALVSVTDADLATTANGGKVRHASGYDILFTASDGTTRLDHEVEQYTAATGAFVGWVRVPVLDGDEDTILYLYYGNPAVDDPRANAAGVWDEHYVGVWHLKEDPGAAAPEYEDSTSNTNNGTGMDNLATDSDRQVDAAVDGGLDLDGDDDYITFGSDTTLDNHTNWTVSVWLNPDVTGSAYNRIVCKSPWLVYLVPSQKFDLWQGFSGAGGRWRTTDACLTTGQWNHVVVTFDNTSDSNDALMYVNGEAKAVTEVDTPSGTANTDGSNDLQLSLPGTTDGSMDGRMDEFRYSKVIRSADWIATCHTNQAAPGDFMAFGSEESDPDPPGGGWASGYRYRKALLINGAKVGGTADLTDFPALVSLTDPDLATTANGGYVTSTNGYDIVFTADDGTTQLDHELELYRSDQTDPSDLVAWVRIPTLSATADTLIWLYYGNASVTESQENAAGVWANGYVGVWHLGEAGETNCDSTAHANHAWPVGGVETNATGLIDGADAFNEDFGYDDNLHIAHDASLLVTDVTCEAWIWMIATNDDARVVQKRDGINGSAYSLEAAYTNVHFRISNGAGSNDLLYGDSGVIETGQWIHIAATFEDASDTCVLYANGAEDKMSTTFGAAICATNYDWAEIGGVEERTARGFYGTIDEVRISAVARSPDWMATQYTNQVDPAGFLGVAAKETTTNIAWKTGYQYRKKLTIDGDTVSGTNNLANFPALVSFTDTDLRTTANGGKLENASGYDLLFTADDGSTRLDHELERHTLSSGELVAWVRIPLLDGDADTVLYMYYGNAAVAGSRENAAGVWDADYVGVWHMKEDPGPGTAGAIRDSTTYTNHGTATAAMTAEDGLAGRMANAIRFDASGDAVETPLSAGFDKAHGAVSLWYRPFYDCGADPLGVNLGLIGWWNSGADQAWALLYNQNVDGTNRLEIPIRVDSAWAKSMLADALYWQSNDWVHLTATWDDSLSTNDQYRIYVNGADQATIPLAIDYDSTNVELPATLAIGDWAWEGIDEMAYGVIDEVRISKTIRSADWLATGYTNQVAPADFLSAASEESDPAPPGGSWASGYTHRKALVIDASKVLGPSDLTNFPALISLTDADLATTANGGYVRHASGYDIIFTAQDGSTQLDHEMEAYTGSSGELVMWVRVPVLSREHDTLIYMYFGSSSVSDSQENAAGVWDADYVGVWHLSETNAQDSTANANHGTAGSGVTLYTAGVVGDGCDFNGVDNEGYIQSAANTNALNAIKEALTLEAWCCWDQVQSNARVLVGRQKGTGGDDLWILNRRGAEGNGLQLMVDESMTNSPSDVPVGEWLYAAGTWASGGPIVLYSNGVAWVAGTNVTLTVPDEEASVDIGAMDNSTDSWTEAFDGKLDEVRVSKTARSAGWLATCHTNQLDPAGWLALAGARETTTNAAWKTGWAYRKKLAIDGDTVSGTNNLANFPALVSLTDADLATLANGGKLESASGYDLIFTDADGTTKLDHEIEKHTLTSGELVAWVRIPVLSYAADTGIYMYYGNPAVDDSQENAAGVWDAGYVGVWHLSEGAGTNTYDSTANAHDGFYINTNDNSWEIGANAKIGACAEFTADTADNDYVRVPDATGLDLTGDTYTVEAWVYPRTGGGSEEARVLEKGEWYLKVGNVPTYDMTFAADDGADKKRLNTASPFETQQWNYVAFHADDGEGGWLVNGAVADEFATLANNTDTPTNLCIGIHPDLDYDHDGWVDEIRISRLDRSVAWLATGYTNMVAPTNFLSAAAEESNPAAPAGSGWASGYRYRKLIALSGERVSGTADLTNFPALVSVTDADLATTAYGGFVTSTNGYDILFTAADGSTQLDHELELYRSDPTDPSDLAAWVRIPVLAHDNDTLIWLYYGNPAVTESQEHATNVWDSHYIAVWHFGEDPAGAAPQFLDSTANTNHASMLGTSNVTAIGSIVGNGLDFPGTNVWLDAPTSNEVNSLDLTGNQITLEAWARVPAGGVDDDEALITKSCYNYQAKYHLGVEDNAGAYDNAGFRINAIEGYSTQALLRIEGVFPCDAWVYTAGAYDGSEIRVIVNEAVVFTTNYTDSIQSSNDDSVAIGRRIGTERYYEGDLDELRISDVARAPAWLATCHTNQLDPAGFLGVAAKETSTNVLWKTGWAYRKKLTIDADTVVGTDNLADFPALVSLTDADLATVSNGGKLASASGYDLLFTADDGSTRLDHEIEQHTLTSGELVAWVRIPALDGDADTVIYMYYGNRDVTASQANAAGVWSRDFGGVWHLSETPNDTVADSTANGNDGSFQNMEAGDQKAGFIDGAIELDGANEYVNVADAASLRPASNLTVMAWIKLAAELPVDNTEGVVTKRYHETDDPWNSYIIYHWTNRWCFGTGRGSAGTWKTLNSTVTTTTNWTHMAATYDGALMSIYLNGEWDATTNTQSGALGYSSSSLRLGSCQLGAQAFPGQLDEVWVLTNTCTAAWLATVYTNQAAPANFLSAGSEETGPALGQSWASGYLYRKSIVIDSGKVSGASDLTDFPALVSLTDPDLAGTANGGYVRNTNGYDIIFTADDGTTQLDHELELYRSDPTDPSDLVAWVRIPTLRHDQDTLIWLYYGNSAISTSQEDAPGVWETDFKGVWHLKEEAGTNWYDSTANANHGWCETNTPAPVAGTIGGAQEFYGTNVITIEDTAGLRISNALTLEAWVEIDASSDTGRIISRRTDAEESWELIQERDIYVGTNSFLFLAAAAADTCIAVISADTAPNVGVWTHVAGVYDPAVPAIHMYVDGAWVRTEIDGVPAVQYVNTADICIGQKSSGTGGTYEGRIDEVRVSAAARSAGWLATSHTNQLDPAGFLTTGVKATTTNTTWKTGYGYRKKLTIDGNLVSGTNNLADYPALVSFTDADLATTANGGHVAHSGGYDIIFTADDGTTKLDHEVELYTDSSGTLAAWVRIPVLDCDADTVIYMYYGNALVSGSQANAAQVWDSNYVGVWHLKETPGTDSYAADSTVWTNHGAIHADMTADDQMAGLIGGSLKFGDSTNEALNCGSADVLDDITNITVSAWIFPDKITNHHSIYYKFDYFNLENDAGQGHLYVMSRWDSNLGSWTTDSDTIRTGAWNHVAYSYADTATANDPAMYIDGVSMNVNDGLAPAGAVDLDTGFDFEIGANSKWMGRWPVVGQLDEVRVSDIIRSAGWLATCHTNMRAPAAFLGAGAEEANPESVVPWKTGGWRYRRSLTIPADKVSGTGDLTNFPVLVSLTDSDMATTANGGYLTNTNGYDAIFTADDGTTQLDHEIETYRSDPSDPSDLTDPSFIAWVRVPLLHHDEDTTLYLYYGNPAISSSQENAAGVWDTNYLAVWHLQQAPTDAPGEIADSTANDVDSRTFNMSSGDRIAATAGFGLNFDGVSQYIETPAGAPTGLWNRCDSALTVEAWARRNGAQADWRPLVIRRRGTTNDEEWWLVKWDDRPRFGIQAANNVSNTEALVLNEWTHLAGAADNTAIRLYVDGAEVTNAPCTVTLVPDTNIVTIAAGQNPDAGEYGNVALDEIRISDIARSAGWLATSHTNQVDPAGFFSTSAKETTTNVSWATGYWYRKKLTIDGDAVSGATNLVDFPALVSLTDAALKTTGNGGRVRNDNGYDILFTADDGATQLDHEQERYTAASGEFIGWVRIPVLDCDGDTVIYLYYGNPQVTTSQEHATNVWSANYVGVWHMKEDPSDPQPALLDSTAYTNDGVCSGELDASDQVEGWIDGSIHFTTNDTINAGSDTPLDDISNLTVSVWCNLDETASGENRIFQKTGKNLWIRWLGADRYLRFVQVYNTQNGAWNSANVMMTGTWQYITMSYDHTSSGNAPVFYLDGAVIATTLDTAPSTTRTSDAANDFWIGKAGAPTDHWKGLLDECQVSDVIRSADWIATCYTNQFAPADFLSAAAEEENIAGAGWKSGWGWRQAIVIDADKVGGSEDLVDFPVLISLEQAVLRHTSDGGRVENANGYDIIFTDLYGTNQLDHEIESYSSDASAGTFVAWVRIPVLDHDDDTTIYLYYGNSGVSASLERVEDVWTNEFLGVWHLAASAGSPDTSDSSANGNDGVNNGTTLATGQIANGLDFEDTDPDYVELPSSVTFLPSNNSPVTISAWFKPESISAFGLGDRMVSLRDAADSSVVTLALGDTDRIQVFIDPPNSTSDWTSTVSAGEWRHVGLTCDGAEWLRYLDGAQEGGAIGAGHDAASSHAAYLGTFDTSQFHYDGILDEVRIARVARSAGWLATCHTNQADPGGFYATGGEETTLSGWLDGYAYRKALVIRAGQVSGSQDLTDFPALISLTDADLKTLANGGHVRNASGYDIVFTQTNGLIRLDHELETYTASTGEFVGWVRIPTLDYDNDTTIYMYYGNPTVATSQENAAGVWDAGFIGVWHMTETAAQDSTTNAQHCTAGSGASVTA